MTEKNGLLQKEDYAIFVPSRGRESMIEKGTGIWKYLKKEFAQGNRHKIFLIVRGCEYSAYSEALKEIGAPDGVYIITVKDEAVISDKRQLALDTAIKEKINKFFIIDDDVCIYFRDEMLSSMYTSREEDFDKMDCFNSALYEALKLTCREFPITGLPIKQGSFGLKYMFPFNIPIIRFVCYDTQTLKDAQIRMDGLGEVFMSDRYAHLSLLEKGFRSLSNCRYCIGDHGTGYKGGCADTRTVALQSQAANSLSKRFPQHVSLKWKTDGLWGVGRWDCTIKWKKFLPEGSESYMPAEEGLRRIGDGI